MSEKLEKAFIEITSKDVFKFKPGVLRETSVLDVFKFLKGISPKYNNEFRLSMEYKTEGDYDVLCVLEYDWENIHKTKQILDVEYASLMFAELMTECEKITDIHLREILIDNCRNSIKNIENLIKNKPLKRLVNIPCKDLTCEFNEDGHCTQKEIMILPENDNPVCFSYQGSKTELKHCSERKYNTYYRRYDCMRESSIHYQSECTDKINANCSDMEDTKQ